MPNVLTNAQIAAFKETGYLAGIPVFSPRECAAFLARVEAFERDYPESVAWAFDIKTNLLFDWVYELSCHDALLDVVEDLLGADIYLTNAIFRIKEPSSSTHYGWHQDAARIEVEPRFVIVYIAIGEATPDNGCLRVIPGSNDRIHPFEYVTYSKRKLARVKDVDERTAVDLVLAPGEVGIFDCNTIHGSGPNRSGQRRLALINDYSAASSRQKRGRGSGQLVRGNAPHGLIGREPVPQGAFTETNILARRKILRTYPENVLMGPLEPGEVPAFADAPDANFERLPASS